MDSSLSLPLRKAIQFLEQAGHRYAIVGGIALAQWGVVRTTRDVDIRVLVPNTDYAATRKVIRSAFPQSARAHLRAHPFVVAVEIEHVIVDFLLAAPGYEELVIERAVRKDLGGWSAYVCSAEDLVIQKIYAQRAKDWLDIEALLIQLWSELDQGYMNSWVEQFSEALEAPEMLERYQQLTAEVARFLRQTPSKTKDEE